MKDIYPWQDIDLDYCGLWCSFIYCMYQSNSPNIIYWRDCFYSIVCSCLLFEILIDHKDVGLFLSFLFCSIDVWVCSYASTRLFFLLQWPCSIIWCQLLWSLQLCSSFSRLLRILGVFYLVPYKFLEYPLSKGNKGNINKWDYMKLKSFSTAKETILKWKGNWLHGRTYSPMIHRTRV